jgi:hypothetical protein
MGKQIAVAERIETIEGTIAASKKLKPRRRKSIIILSGLLVVAVCASLLLFVKYKHAASDSPVSKQQQLTKQLSQVIEMPAGQPVISTVLDKSKLTNPALQQRAHNGDVLFIFPQSKRLILYRPADKKVVDMLTIQ